MLEAEGGGTGAGLSGYVQFGSPDPKARAQGRNGAEALAGSTTVAAVGGAVRQLFGRESMYSSSGSGVSVIYAHPSL